MYQYVMALDSGTTSNRCILFTKQGEIAAIAQQEFTQYFPTPGEVEHDAEEIWETQLSVAREAMKKAGAKPEDIAAIGITNQRETAIMWDKTTGKPVCHAIVWQDRRTAAFCDELMEKGCADMLKKKTGLLIDPYFSATKIRWILENVPGVREKAEKGEVLFGTVETWLIWNLTGGKKHVTDYSNASRTMLFNIHDLCWDQEILELLNIPEAILPEARPSSEIYGETETELFGAPIRIGGAAGDQQSALFGQACFEKGDAKNTYGTGCFLLMNTGETPVESENGLVTTIAWGIGDQITYALEGSVFVAGSAVQWLRDEMDFFNDSAESEKMATSVPDTNGVYVVPAFTGLAAPYWDSYARGSIVGLTRGANRCHIVRATLESIAYQCYDVLAAMTKDLGYKLNLLKVDGGASANNFLMQFQADIMKETVERPMCVETTAMGAAFLAGLAVGFYEDLEEIAKNRSIGRVFSPQMDDETRRKMIHRWHRAVHCALNWAKEE